MLILLRFALSLLFFLASLLAVVKAPTNVLWKLSIAVIEWGQYFALIVLVLLFFNANYGGLMNKVALGFNLVAIILFFSTLIRAYTQKAAFEESIQQVFPVKDKSVRTHALSFTQLFTGLDYKTEKPTEYVFDEAIGLKLDFYPTARKNAPCVIVVHGGAWSSGDNKQLPLLNSYLAGRGYAVAAISYRLAPQYQYPTQLADVLKSIQWVKQNAKKLGVDTTNIVLLGRSAGAQLALQAAYTHIDMDIKGVISFYCPADMVWGYSIPGNPRIMNSRQVLDEYIGASAYERKDLYETASPTYHITSDVPPTLLLHGQADVMVAREHSRRMNEKLTKAGIRHVFIDFPWATHGYDFAFNGPSSQISLYAIEHFLANVCVK